MKTTDAAKILGLSGEVTPETVKDAYRRQAQRFHPDKNPAGLEMMQAVNTAYEALKDFAGDVDQEPSQYADELNDALNVAVACAGLDIEVCGAWIWVTGNTREHKDTLKAAGYRWAPKKKSWYFRPDDWKGGRGNADMDDIRAKYGSTVVKSQGPRRLQYA